MTNLFVPCVFLTANGNKSHNKFSITHIFLQVRSKNGWRKWSLSLVTLWTLASFAEVSISSNMVLKLAALNLSRILPNQTKPEKMQIPGWAQSTHLHNGCQRFGCPLKFEKNCF